MTRKNSKAKVEKVYTMFDGDFRRFTFTAENDERAQDKAWGWARYHGFSTNDVKAVEPNEHELTWPTNNEYVAKY